GAEPRPELHAIMEQLKSELQRAEPAHLERVASRTGERVQLLAVSQITHFFAQDKLTYAALGAKNYVVDFTIFELEQKLDPKKFVRIHRSTLVNLDYLHELDTWFGGGVLARLRDSKGTELPVSRDRVKALKQALGVR